MEPIQFDREKFLDVIHLICHRIDAAELGRVKLHKALYFSDMIWFADRLRPLPGVEYQKQAFGPTAKHLAWGLRELEHRGRILVRGRDYFGHRKFDFISQAEPDFSRLSADEVQLIGDVADFVSARSAKQISDLSHNAAWEIAEIGETIPYSTAHFLYPVEIRTKMLSGASMKRWRSNQPVRDHLL